MCQIQREMKSLRERGVGKTIKEMHSTGDIYLFEPQIKNAMDILDRVALEIVRQQEWMGGSEGR